MALSRADAKAQVERLVDRFSRLSAHNRKGYNEAATRLEFILPLFRALGWNTENAREVSPEEQVSRGYVDYAFRLQGIPRFFLETKKIPTDLDDPRWAQQAINYAWLKGVTWAVLTDFEGLKVLNAEWQETVPARAIFKDLHWQQYLDCFDDLWLLSRPAMEEGALDRVAEAVGRKVKRTPVSRLLFADLTEWRRALFQTLRQYNRARPIEHLDQAVQRILDRLIFIRTCEDRGIEPYRLQPMLREWRDQGRKKDLVTELNSLFREFDQVYDSRLFAPHLCEQLTSEPAPYERAIEGLYEVPGGYGRYDFNAIDADVLGTIYEQYLGHRAQDPKGEQVVDKRAKRKAQGIYYTPQFVVRYIVQQTLGRLLGEADYEQARQVKVLDMACGSGSFLIEAFNVLDRYLARVRGQDTPLAQSVLGEGPGVRVAGDTHDFARRMEILSHNLYGVDLDAQAVEIAQLNLLLKAVNQRGQLPSLDNIRQGNSLISGTPAEMEAAFGANWCVKRPFNWAEQFPAIMERGGFDVIVGNPPYIRIQTLPKDDAAWYNGYYQAAMGNYDIYVLFVERALQLLRPGGVVGFILPNKFFTASYGQGLRKLLSEPKAVSRVVDFEDAQVFENSTTYTCLLFASKAPSPKAVYIPAGDWLKKSLSTGSAQTLSAEELPESEVPAGSLSEEPWVLVPPHTRKLVSKIEEAGPPLYKLALGLFTGLQTSADKVFILQRHADSNDLVRVFSRQTGGTYELERAALRPILLGKHVRRYHIDYHDLLVIFPYRLHPDGGFDIIPADEVARYWPNTWAYLLENRAELEQREKGRMAHETWYGYAYPKNLDQFSTVKLVNASMGTEPRFAFDYVGAFGFVGGGSGVYGISLKAGSGLRYEYVLGLLNGCLLDFYFKQVSSHFRGGFYVYRPQYVGRLPIRRINFDDPVDVARHDRMVTMVEEMLRLQKEHAQVEAQKEDRRHDLARQIEQLDAQIDALVYELYGLTEEEIRVVEGTVNGL